MEHATESTIYTNPRKVMYVAFSERI